MHIQRILIYINCMVVYTTFYIYIYSRVTGLEIERSVLMCSAYSNFGLPAGIRGEALRAHA